jgi:hypothetical protein
MITIPDHKGNENQNHTKIPSHPLEWLSSRTPPKTIAGDVGEKVTLIHCWWECKLVQPLWKPLRRKTKHISAI